jgi:hypothetical protein
LDKAVSIPDDTIDMDVPFHRAKLLMKMGRVDEALISMEATLELARKQDSRFAASSAVVLFEKDVKEKGKSLLELADGKFPNILWALKVSGIELSKEQSAFVKAGASAKEVLCTECGVKLKKVYRCGRCGIAHYCGTSCQKRAWPAHRKVCQKPAEERNPAEMRRANNNTNRKAAIDAAMFIVNGPGK